MSLGPAWGQTASFCRRQAPLTGWGGNTFLPGVQGHGSWNCPARPLPGLSRSPKTQRRGDLETLPAPSRGGRPRTLRAGCRGFWAGSSGMPLPPHLAHSRHSGYLPMPYSRAPMEPGPARRHLRASSLGPRWLHCSNSSRFGMSLFTINVNPTLEHSALRGLLGSEGEQLGTGTHSGRAQPGWVSAGGSPVGPCWS